MEESQSHTPLESFLLDYLEAVDGAWEEVEPQVYDVLLPEEMGLDAGAEPLRLAFDPEAVPEHAGSHLLTYGSPLLERLLDHACQQSRTCRVYLTGINLAVHGLEEWVRTGVAVPAGSTWKIGRVRPLFYAHAAFWFQATFSSDEKEQENYINVVDLHYGRFARHLEELLRGGALPPACSRERPFPWPDASRIPLAQAYAQARRRVAGTAASVAQAHRAEQEQRLEKQVGRMQGYYRDLEQELAERLDKARVDGRTSEQSLHSLEERLQGVGREEGMRIAELRQRSTLQSHLRLLNVLLVVYAKLCIRAELVPQEGSALELTLVGDPILGQVEPLDCPQCGRPTRELVEGPRRAVGCAECLKAG